MADTTSTGGRVEKWTSVAKAIAFELKPFSLPTRQDVVTTWESLARNSGQVAAEVKRLAPEAVRVAKGFNPLGALALFAWLCGWALFIWVEFGAVYFIVSAMTMIFVNLGEREEGEWSAYSVFNAGCRALLGTINAEQFEREIMRQNVAAPDHGDDDDDFVFVEPEPQPRAGGDGVDGAGAGGDESDYDDDTGDESGGDGGGAGAAGGAARGAGGGRKVSGKRARRGFEERRERREERRLALQALGPQGDWN